MKKKFNRPAAPGFKAIKNYFLLLKAEDPTLQTAEALSDKITTWWQKNFARLEGRIKVVGTELPENTAPQATAAENRPHLFISCTPAVLKEIKTRYTEDIAAVKKDPVQIDWRMPKPKSFG